MAVEPRVSEVLSHVIESATADSAVPHPPTLGAVRDSMRHGLMARLVFYGALEPDEEPPLLEEIETLIRRHGADALSEPFSHSASAIGYYRGATTHAPSPAPRAEPAHQAAA